MDASMRPSLLTLLLIAVMPVDDVRAASDLCGQTITTSITFSADQNCTGNGLIVGADGVTIDLGGFTLTGDRGSSDLGITSIGHSQVVIRNGTVRNFDQGIFISGGGETTSVKMTNVIVRDNVHEGANIAIGVATVTHSAFIDNGGSGVFFQGFSDKGSLIASSAFVGNGGAGFQISGGSKSKLTGLTATGNSVGVVLNGANLSFRSSAVAANTTDGVVLIANGSITIAKTVIVGNLRDGVRVTNTIGTSVIASNVIGGNGANGVHLVNDSSDVSIVGNRLIGNAVDGVKVESTAANLVKGNTAVGNGGSGFSTTNAVTTFTKNVANANGGGIFASTAIDGGGNTARANVGTQCSSAIACPPAFTPKPGNTMAFCGNPINLSMKLDNDPALCAGTSGFNIIADDITIDLNGHRLHGDRTGSTVGIDVGNHKNVTIKNGIIQGFGAGILSGMDTEGLKIENVEVRDSVNVGARLNGSGVVIDKSVVVNNSGPGVMLGEFGASGAKVSSSFFVGNTGDGFTSQASGSVLSNVTSTGNVGIGIHLTTGGDGKLVGGTVAGNSDAGITIDGSFGMFVQSPNIVKKMFVAGNGTDGIDLEADSFAMTFDSNFAGGNGDDGIVLSNVQQNAIAKKNALVGNASDGLFVDTSVMNASVVQNTAVGNFNGLNVDAASSTLAKNSADANLGKGISTPFGASDGGGNTAHDNADVQCTAPIVCN